MEIWKSTVEEMVINPQFWKGKKVLLTGHTGFKGSWMSLWLQKLGVNLLGFSKSIPTTPSLFQTANVENGMTSIMGDVRDIQHIRNMIRDFEPEIIIHMAAQSLVLKSYDDPVETYSTNVMGTVNLLESVRTVGKNIRVIINVTSDKCYDNVGLERDYKEDDPMGGFDPYSSSKGCAELITSSYRNSFFNLNDFEKHHIALASVRAGNVIGGGDWSKNRLIPDIMNGILGKSMIKIRHPNAIRPWQFVLDPLEGYLLLIEKLWENGLDYAGAYNFGPTLKETKPVSWIVEKLTKSWGNSQWEVASNAEKHESPHLKLNCTKAKNKLNWEAKVNLELALQWIIDWYKKYEQKNNMRNFTELQIENHNLLN